MTDWKRRSHEEKCLLNPSFCAVLLWQAALARQQGQHSLLSFEESFLILPFTLDRQLREQLPRSSRTSLPVWLTQYPLAKGKLTMQTRLLVPYTKESLLFAGTHAFISVNSDGLRADQSRAKSVQSMISTSTDEVQDCAKKARFLGRWFAEVGTPSTVFALLGVRP